MPESNEFVMPEGHVGIAGTAVQFQEFARALAPLPRGLTFRGVDGREIHLFRVSPSEQRRFREGRTARGLEVIKPGRTVKVSGVVR